MRWQELKNNPIAKEKLRLRGEILKFIREFFWQNGFLEVETPLLVKDGNLEPNLELFRTELKKNDGIKCSAHLITSPEYGLKKLLAVGFPKIFQLGKCFRNNEPWGGAHNPEFTMLEWYEASENYFGLMYRVEKLFHVIASHAVAKQSRIIEYQGRKIDISQPWLRLSMREVWQKYADADLNNLITYDTMLALVKEKKYSISVSDTWADLFFKIFLSEVEPKVTALNQPVFLYDYPVPLAALSRVKKDDQRYAERFELYIGGLEIANAYSELIDWQEQEKRFQDDVLLRQKLGKEMIDYDRDLIAALKSGLPECAGISIGVDRLVMLLTNSKNIEEIMPFTASELFNK
ncbi:MAG: EF-P lysine aminoacylase GenX [Candidatus Magasanikbacteria bacterium]|nr:EF-P lysine aminoacylase GenX [Candidatus Magasanikbacteria bacterium]